MENFIIGALIGLGILIFKGDKNHEQRKPQTGSNSLDSSGIGSKHSSNQKVYRPRVHRLTAAERTARLKLKTARLQYLTERLKKQKSKEVRKDEPVDKEQSHVTGSVSADNSGSESDRSNGKTSQVLDNPKPEHNQE